MLMTFQSAPPVKGATGEIGTVEAVQDVSIRAPREGGDCGPMNEIVQYVCFNPRPP